MLWWRAFSSLELLKPKARHHSTVASAKPRIARAGGIAHLIMISMKTTTAIRSIIVYANFICLLVFEDSILHGMIVK